MILQNQLLKNYIFINSKSNPFSVTNDFGEDSSIKVPLKILLSGFS